MTVIQISFPCIENCSKCELCKQIEQLQNSKIKTYVDDRIAEFKNICLSDKKELFLEMCFCILTANFNAMRAIQIQEQIGIDFIILSQEDLARKLKDVGYRFPNIRAQYICESRKHYHTLREKILSFSYTEQKLLRTWLVKNIKGLGLKEASHFLRNIGYEHCAIIDFHIIDLLVSYGIIERPKNLTKKRYEEVELILEKIAHIQGVNLAELDLYLWYLETGKILK
ncbi:MAG: N-glycosylase/DNA lyase [Candidatus Lokiarchaeota archaeon]|nr:N-glycosylase/DNA lyase [Candidatus Lokiarchaeota archaeon]